MTNALPDTSKETVTGVPAHGDVVLAPQADGGCLLAQHPGGWQVCFSSHADAVNLAVRYATKSGAHVWLQTVENQYERIGGVAPIAEMS